MQNFALITLGERNGAIQYRHHLVVETQAEDLDLFGNSFAADFYSSPSEMVDGEFHFAELGVAVWLNSIKPLTGAEADFLRHYI